MDPEISAKQQLDESKAQIEEALALIDKVATLRAALMIKTGAGRRYLEHAKPSIQQLKNAEQAILTEYATGKTAKKPCKKTNLVQTMSLKGMA